MMEGRLTLHGIEKSISIPLHLSATDGELRTRGEASLLQTDFGIAPIKVGGGTVKVKNLVRVRFDVVADASGP
jgi:polyisoprenoid-binding protein YceI